MGTIRPVQPDDADAIVEIYNHYIEKTIITFEETPISSSEIRTRIQTLTVKYPWLVYIDNNDNLLGYAYMGPYHARCAYRKTAEVSIYLEPLIQGQGIGSRLMTELLEQTAPLPIHTLIGGIALPNPASVRLHEKFGFVQVGHFKEVGFKFNQWIDVGYWEKILSDTE